MANSNNKFKNLISRTKIYLIIIGILQILLCIQNKIYIIPSIIIFILILAYSKWTNNKKLDEISKHIQDVTLNVDSTIKSSIINSPFSLIILETDGNIIWKSPKFVSEFANIDINNNLKDLVKEIKKEIIESKSNKNEIIKYSIEKQIQVGKSTYKVLGEYAKSKKKKQNEYMITLYFINDTEHLKNVKKLVEKDACIGFIMIDNYDEIIELLPDGKKSEILAEVEKKIFEWAYKNNGAVIKSDRRTYAYFIEKKDLEEIKKGKFEILDIIKELETDENVNVTLSIAISNDGDTNQEKYKEAQAAMDIVLGRGGDQAAVKENGKYTFFGGRTLEVEKRTKVKARTIARALEQLIKESQNVVIMGHSNPDIDSIGSSLGIYKLAKCLGKEAYVVNNNINLSIKSFMNSLESEEDYTDTFLNKIEALNIITNETLLVIIDTNKKDYVEVPELLEETNKIVVIDHHRKSPESIENAILTFHEVYASSAAELVTEILQYTQTNVELSTLEAEGLYAGIITDTKNFTFKTGVRTFEAAAYLRKKSVDILKIKRWFQANLKSYNQIAEIVKDAEIVNNTIAVSIYEKEDKNVNLICAKAADELLTISEITASFVIGKFAEKIFISGRSIGDVNVQLVLEKLGGGGHITVAGAQLEGYTLEEAKAELINKINEYINEI